MSRNRKTALVNCGVLVMKTWPGTRGGFLVAILLGLLSQGLGPCRGDTDSGRAGLLTITWFETGASLAVALETPSDKVFLIDTATCEGTEAVPDYNAGRDVISPFLKKRGHAGIDGILISHPHTDHFGGAAWLMEHWKVRQFIDHGYPLKAKGMPVLYPPLREMAVKNGCAYRVVHAGDTLDWDSSLQIEVLSPPEGVFEKPDPGTHSSLNMNSIVLRVQHGKNVFIFPGDAYHASKDVPAEKLKGLVLTSPHHGFHPGSNFTKLTVPQYVVVTCAADYLNNAGTPYPRSPGSFAIEKYGALGIGTFVTAFDGNITARSDGKEVTMTRQRKRVIPQPK